MTHEFSTSDSLNLASSEEEEADTSVLLEVSSEFEDITYEEGDDGSDIPDLSDLSVADEEGAADDADNRTPKKVVEIDLTASPEVSSSSASPPGTNHGCSVCLDSLRDIR